MRVVIYTQHMVPLHIIELDEDELQTMASIGEVAVQVPSNPVYDDMTDAELVLKLRMGRFRMGDGMEMPFLVLLGSAGLGMLATDTQGAFPDGSHSAARFRKEFSYRLIAMLMEARGVLELGS